METSEDDVTTGHELYVRHILLLGQAAPLALKAVIHREIEKHGKDLATLIDENINTFNNNHKSESLQLFEAEEVKTNIDSWDIRLLCVVTQVLFESDLAGSELGAIACISDQWKDLDNYARDTSIPYKTFEEKWGHLHSVMLGLIDHIDGQTKQECKRMIISFGLEPIKVNMELIKECHRRPMLKFMFTWPNKRM